MSVNKNLRRNSYHLRWGGPPSSMFLNRSFVNYSRSKNKLSGLDYVRFNGIPTGLSAVCDGWTEWLMIKLKSFYENKWWDQNWECGPQNIHNKINPNAPPASALIFILKYCCPIRNPCVNLKIRSPDDTTQHENSNHQTNLHGEWRKINFRFKEVAYFWVGKC